MTATSSKSLMVCRICGQDTGMWLDFQNRDDDIKVLECRKCEALVIIEKGEHDRWYKKYRSV